MKPALSRMGWAALNIAVFFGALVLGCLGIGALLPPVFVPQVTTKLDFFRAHADEFDTVFVGSSRVYHQLKPDLFDEITRAKGRPTKSFNAAIDGMRSPELTYYLDQLLKCRPKNLRHIIIENNAVKVSLDEDKRGTVRNAYWHDFERLFLVARVALADRKLPKKKSNWRKRLLSYQEPMGFISEHAELTLRNFLNLGRGEILTAKLVAAPQVSMEQLQWDPVLGTLQDGFISTGREEKIKLVNLDILNRNLAERWKKSAVIDYDNDESQRSLETVMRKFEDRGVVPVQFVPPTTGSRKFLLRSAETTPRVVLDYTVYDFTQLHFGVPQTAVPGLIALDFQLWAAAAQRIGALPVHKYDVLYDSRYRIDTDHLNLLGAEALTRIAAEEFCERAPRQP